MYDAGTAALSITVSFRGIQREIRKQATIIAKELEQAIQHGLEEGFKGGAPTKEGAKQGRKFGDAFSEVMKKRIEIALRTLPEAKIGADTSEVEEKLAAIRGDLKELSGKRIGIDISEQEAEAQIKQIRDELLRLSKESPTVKVSASTAKAAEQLRRFEAQVERIRKEDADIVVDADTAKASVKMKRVGEEADKLGAKRETITVNVNTKGAERSLARVARSADSTNQRMSRGAKLALGYSAAIGLLSPIAGAGAVGMINLAAAILPVSGLLAGLPAAILGTVGAMTVLHVALNNVGSAISAGLSGDTKQFEQAMGKLTGTAQNFVNAIVKLKPQLDTLKNSLQSHLLAGMASQFTYMANKVLPRLTGPLTRVAGGFNDIFRAALKAGATAKNIASMRVVLDSVAKGLHNASGAVGPLLAALGTMGRVIAPILANLSGGLTGLAKRFNNFIQAAAKSGQLADWFNTGLEVLRQLGDVAKGVFGIVKGIFKAAAGGGSSSALLTLVNVLNKAVNSISGQKGLTAVFDSFKKVGTALAPVLGAVGRALVPLAKMFSDLVVGLAPGATALLDNLAPAFANLGKAATPVANAVAAVAEAIAPLLPEIGSILANELIVLAGILQTVANAFAPLLYVVGKVAGTFARMITTVLINLARVILPVMARGAIILTNAFRPIVPVLAQMARQFATTFAKYMPQFAAVLQKLLPVLTQVGLQLAQVLLTTLIQMAPYVPEIAKSLAQMAIAGAQLMIQLAPMLPTIVGLVAQLLIWALRSGALQVALNLVVKVLQIFLFGIRTTVAVAKFLVDAWQKVNNFFSKTLPHAFGVVVNAILGFKHQVDGIGKYMEDFFTKKIPAWIGTMVGKAKSLWGDVVGRIKDLWHDLQNNALYPIRDFFTKKIPSWAGTLAGKVKSLWGGIVGRVKDLWHDLLNNVVYKIRDFFTKSIPSWTGTLSGKVKSLWGGIVGRVKTLWHDLLNNVVYKIRDFFTKSIPSWTGTLSGKVKSLWGGMVGRVKTLWNGLKSSVIDPIKDFFTKKIPAWSGTLAGAVKKNMGSLAGSMKKIWNDIKNYVKGPIKGILGMLHDMFHAVEVVADKFKIKAVKSAAVSAAATMTTWRNKVNGWAVGGPVHGPGTGTSDDIPAYLSNNEHVWTAKETRAVGGHRRMIELRQAALRGDLYPAYAKGGPVTHAGAPGFASGGYLIPSLITKIAQKIQNGVRMTSGFRPGSRSLSGNSDYHSQGKAADLVSGNMDGLAAAFYKVKSYLLEEIHTRANSNTGWYVKNGHAVGPSFYGAEVPVHRDHVHIAMNLNAAQDLLSELSGAKGSGSSLLDKIKAFAGSLAGGPASLFDWATDFYDKYFKKYVDKIAAFGKDGNNGIAGGLVSGVGKQVMDGTMDWVKGKFESLLTDFGGGNGDPYAKGIPTSGTLASWIHKAMGLTHVSDSWYPMLYRIAMRESRGNPRAINNYDINAKNGIPSKGVMQIIPPMYKKFHQAGTSWNMYDPISNIAAAINYIKGVYGSPANTPYNYYDVGGILKPGATLAVNHTGRNEYVLRNDQVQSLAAQGAALAARQIAAMAAAGRGGPGLVVNARELNLDTVDYQRLSAKIDRQRVLDGLLVP